MKKLIYLLMSLSLVAFVSCSDDKDSPSNIDNTQTDNGSKGNSTSGDGGDSNDNVSVIPFSKSGTEDGHDYVDLGLPSGTKWATCNVGAATPQDYGNYYAWGETTTMEIGGWGSYKYGSGQEQLTKYCDVSRYGKDGFTDSKTTLDLEDDAAYVNWGGKWRMPTQAQINELFNECYWVWTENYNNSNVKGCIVYKAKISNDKNKWNNKNYPSSYILSDAHIFLPAAGYRGSGGLYSAGSDGKYWATGLIRTLPYYATQFIFNSDHRYNDRCDKSRCAGLSVRAVIPGN